MMALLSMVWYSLLAFMGLTVRPEKSSVVFIDPDRIIPLGGGCPDDAKCSIACQENFHYQSKGFCVGSDKALCSCETPHLLNEHRPVNSEATVCDIQECMKKCDMYLMPLSARCVGDACKCVINI